MSARAIKIAIMALGGQGGGVLAEWIVRTGERAGFIAQSTSVPGVAQRTGATIYYIELFPKSEAERKGKAPVLALMPAPGDLDIVIAAEMMEAGRALTRDFLSKQTTIIASTHRVYAIGEKIAMGEGRQDTDPVRAAVERAAGACVWIDMEQVSQEAGAVISAVMFGALAGSRALPLPREAFEETIREAGRAVERNLKGFSQGFDAAVANAPSVEKLATPEKAAPVAAPAVKPLADRVTALPEGLRDIAFEGLKKVVDHQDAAYGDLYLQRLAKFAAIDSAKAGGAAFFKLSKAVAKYLALAMAYDDVVRVADLKTRASRFTRVREDVRAGDKQIIRVFEFMHPRVEEVCDMLPPTLASAILKSKTARGALSAALWKGRRVATTNLGGFLMLNTLASLKFLRRGSSRYAAEQARIDGWLDLIGATAGKDYALACEIAGLQRLIKGYGETHQRGLANYQRILASLDAVSSAPRPAEALARLRDAALKDEEGTALGAALAKLGDPSAAAA